MKAIPLILALMVLGAPSVASAATCSLSPGQLEVQGLTRLGPQRFYYAEVTGPESFRREYVLGSEPTESRTFEGSATEAKIWLVHVLRSDKEADIGFPVVEKFSLLATC